MKPPAPRDQAYTGFTAVLDALLAAVPEALCAVFVDGEGETVDLATRIDAFDARITGAEFTIVLATTRASAHKVSVGSPLEVRVEGTRRSAVARVVSEGYDLVLLVAAPTITARVADQVAQAAVDLLHESGLPPPPSFARLRSSEPTPRLSSRFQGIGPLVIEDAGVQRRVEQMLGFAQTESGVEVLVRLEGGEELMVCFDSNTNRWTRTPL